jgi:hypothetical protein
MQVHQGRFGPRQAGVAAAEHEEGISVHRGAIVIFRQFGKYANRFLISIGVEMGHADLKPGLWYSGIIGEKIDESVKFENRFIIGTCVETLLRVIVLTVCIQYHRGAPYE